ncbi:hypothetical protein D3C87_1208300 [compost metagenome]
MRFLNMNSSNAKALLCLIILVSSSLSNAVSRVGGGRVSSTSSGFELSVPFPFVQIGLLSADAVRASGPMAYFAEQGMRQQFIDVLEFESDFRDKSHHSRDDLRQEFISAGWVNLETSSCVAHFKKENGSVIAHVVSWGSGQGYILRGPYTADVSQAMDAILKSQQRVSAECLWK